MLLMEPALTAGIRWCICVVWLLTGGGLEHIVKQLGYGDDPLNQRSSSGWKATKTAEILNDAYMVRIESVVDRYSKKISSN